MAIQLHFPLLFQVADNSDGTQYEGTFLSPLATLYPGILPEESKTTRFDIVNRFCIVERERERDCNLTHVGWVT